MLTPIPPAPRRPRDEARAWLRRTLIALFAENATEQAYLEEYGDGLFACAELYAIPDESLIWWLQNLDQTKDVSLAAWRAWCQRYAADAVLAPAAALVLPTLREEPEPVVLCSSCHARIVQRIDGLWWCAKCGVVHVRTETEARP